MKKLFLGLVLAAPILIACSDEASSSNPSGANAPEPSSSVSESSADVPKSSSDVPESSAKMGDDVTKNKTEISYGTMTDPRDGKEYKTITAKMFDGKDTLVSDTWMTEDLAYDLHSVVDGDTFFVYAVENGLFMYQGDAVVMGKCPGYFDGSSGNCELLLPFQGICPDGWHLPDSVEANRWRNFLKNGNGVGDAFYRPSSSEECGFVDFLFTVVEENYGFLGLEARAECAGKARDYSLDEATVRCVKGDAYVEPVEVYPSYDGDFGTFKDSRDDKSYQTVVIGTQTWMSQNLDYATEESVAILGGVSVPDERPHGRAYSWSEAMAVCPEGWRLPSEADFKTLADFAKGEWPDYSLLALLGEANGWEMNTYDAYGFNAFYDSFNGIEGTLPDKGGAFYWTTTEDGDAKAVAFQMYYDAGSYLAAYPKEERVAVRCLKE